MSRNLKPEYINKILKMEVPDGYAFDIGNYLYNPSYDYEYPSFIKTLEETDEHTTIRRVYYFKYHGGNGEYKEEVFRRPKTEGWAVSKRVSEKVLAESNRFSINKLISFI